MFCNTCVVAELVSKNAQVRIDPSLGGRVVALQVEGQHLVVDRSSEVDHEKSAFEWGIFPMVPFAGRVRDGRFVHNGIKHQLPLRMPPHAIHGVVDDVPWSVENHDIGSVEMRCELGSTWPFRAEVSHRVELRESSLWLELSLTAHESMPAQVGWHPWFRRPAKIKSSFSAWIPRDEEGMPTTTTEVGVPSLDSPVDDCFVSEGSPVTLTVDGRTLSLRSNCSHWVVYTEAQRGVCVEPQSGPPNELERTPQVLKPGEALRRWFEIAW